MRVVEDRRIAGAVRHILLREDEAVVQVPPDVLKCVGFLYTTGKSTRTSIPQGTVFFVSVFDQDPHPFGERYWTYAVTSRHVIASLMKERHKEGYIRLNMNSGKGMYVLTTRLADWKQHSSTEVAIIDCDLPSDVDCEPFPIRQLLIGDIVEEQLIGPGDDVFLTGLFARRPGEHQNIPLLRTGTIAAMPGEPIQTDRGTFQAYLIEARSIPGMSGSPVFVNLAGVRKVKVIGQEPHGVDKYALITPRFYLLGVAYGHYQELVYKEGKILQRLNTGIALVVSAKRIQDLIFSREEIEMRKKRTAKDKKVEAKHIAADRVEAQEPTRDVFFGALRRASRRPATTRRPRSLPGPTSPETSA